MNKKIPKI